MKNTVIKCVECEHKSFTPGNGDPGRYVCTIAKTECTPWKLICRTERHKTEFTIKRTPKWCPLKN